MMRPRTLALLALLPLPPAPGPGAAVAQQPDTVGGIDRILDLRPAPPHTIPDATERVQLQRAPSPDWRNVAAGMPVVRADRIRVRPETLVRLGIDTPAGAGRADLGPRLVTEGGPLVLSSVDIGGTDDGIYEIRETPERLGGFELAVARGSLALDWVRGRLDLFCTGVRSSVEGTRILLSVDRAGETAVLHVLEGTVTFPDFPAVMATDGQVVNLRLGQPPTLFDPGAEAAESLERAGRWTMEGVWPRGRPFYRSPWLLLGVAAAAVGTWQLLDDGGGETPSRRGVVIVRIGG